MLQSMLDAVKDIVELCAPDVLHASQLQNAFERYKAVFTASAQRRRERRQRQQAEDFDEEEAEALQVGTVTVVGEGGQGVFA